MPFSDTGANIVLVIAIVLIVGAIVFARLAWNIDDDGLFICLALVCTILSIFMFIAAFASQNAGSNTEQAIEDLRQQGFSVLRVNTAEGTTDLGEVSRPMRERLKASDGNIDSTEGVAVLQKDGCTAAFGLWRYGGGKYHLITGSSSPLRSGDPNCPSKSEELDRLFGVVLAKKK